VAHRNHGADLAAAGGCGPHVMGDTDSIPEGKQGSTARMIRTILVYALEITQARAGPRLSVLTRAISALGRDREEGNEGRQCGREPDEPGALERALISHYGLTRQEASLAERLVRGRSLEEAAAELCISSTAARTHLKRIFLKAELRACPKCAARSKPTTAGSS